MRRWLKTGLVLAVGLTCEGGSLAWGQVRERDVTITGPRGRTLERSIRSERVPGGIDRQIDIHRPAGTFHSETFIPRGPGGFGGRPMPGPAFRGGGYPRPFIERDVYVRNAGVPFGAALLGGAGLLGLGMVAGSALSAPPPPPVYYGPPVVYAPAPPTVVYAPPQPLIATPPPPATVVVDPVATEIARMQSHHEHSRRDAAANLGRLRDPRAVPALMDHLKNDKSKEVRVAAAVALGSIGDPNTVQYLERSTIYDKKQEVRDAAAQAIARINAQTAANPPQTANAVPRRNSVTVPRIESNGERVPPPPEPDGGFRN